MVVIWAGALEALVVIVEGEGEGHLGLRVRCWGYLGGGLFFVFGFGFGFVGDVGALLRQRQRCDLMVFHSAVNKYPNPLTLFLFHFLLFSPKPLQ